MRDEQGWFELLGAVILVTALLLAAGMLGLIVARIVTGTL